MAVVILYAQDCEVLIDGGRRVLINMVEMKADAVRFADPCEFTGRPRTPSLSHPGLERTLSTSNMR
jgi:hypothetical protein